MLLLESFEESMGTFRRPDRCEYVRTMSKHGLPVVGRQKGIPPHVDSVEARYDYCYEKTQNAIAMGHFHKH